MILVTGGTSPLGKVLIPKLKKLGYEVDNGEFVENSYNSDRLDCTDDYCLIDKFQDLTHKNEGYPTEDWVDLEYVISLAGFNGNIAFNEKYPADIFYKNTMMACNILHEAQKYSKRLVYLMPTCAYEDSEILHEYSLGPPHPSVECHGLARRNYLYYARQLWKQYKFPCVGIALNTIYGPTDRFDEKSKVISAMIKRIVDAHLTDQKDVTFWGNGEVYRGFIYSEDAADAIICYKDSEDHMELTNIPCHEIKIRDLAIMIKSIVGYKGKIKWDTSKPNGQYRKMLNTDKNKLTLGFEQKFSLEEGIALTIQGYKNARISPK